MLAAVLPIAGIGAVWSADEGALLYQATAVADGQGWTFDHPFPAADPAGRWFPIHLSSFAADGGYVVLGKHTMLVWLVGLVFGLGGYPAVLALSGLGALVSAGAASRLASRIDPRAAIPALWLTGIASPLFLSTYVAWAHTLAAAFVGLALVGLTTRWSSQPSGLAGPGRQGGRLGTRTRLTEAGGAAALGIACLLRTEATLAAIAVTIALLVVPRLRQGRRGLSDSSSTAAPGRSDGPDSPNPPSPSPPSPSPVSRGAVADLAPAILAGLASVAGYGLDRATSVDRLGPVRPPGDRWGGLAGRFEGFAHTWLRPDFSSDAHHLLFLLGAVALLAAAIAGRRRSIDSGPITAMLAFAALAVLLRFAIDPTALIPGLVVAFPLLFAGFALLRRQDLRTDVAPILVGFVCLFWFAVLATQYRYGGGGEWGGRYFAIGLPAAVPVATVALLRTIEPLEATGRRRVLALAGIVTLLPVTMGILGLRDARVRTAALTDRVDAELVEAGDGGSPVVVTTLAPLGRWAWEDINNGRWLLVTEDDLADVGARLDDIGVERLVFVSGEAEDELAQLADWYRPIEPLPDGPAADLGRVGVTVQRTGG